MDAAERPICTDDRHKTFPPHHAHPFHMSGFSPLSSALLADLMLVLHVGIVSFVVGGQLLFVLGGILAWAWVRERWIRLAHLVLIAFVVVQSWLGAVCPLTIWEQALRQQSGQAGYAESFIEHWLSRLIFFRAPAWVFVMAYSLFGALVLLTWWWLPPGRFRPNKKG
jgi:polyferredoxin